MGEKLKNSRFSKISATIIVKTCVHRDFNVTVMEKMRWQCYFFWIRCIGWEILRKMKINSKIDLDLTFWRTYYSKCTHNESKLQITRRLAKLIKNTKHKKEVWRAISSLVWSPFFCAWNPLCGQKRPL